MKLTELVKDPLEGFDEDTTPTAAEEAGRQAVREALLGIDEPKSKYDPHDGLIEE